MGTERKSMHCCPLAKRMVCYVTPHLPPQSTVTELPLRGKGSSLIAVLSKSNVIQMAICKGLL